MLLSAYGAPRATIAHAKVAAPADPVARFAHVHIIAAAIDASRTRNATTPR